LLRHVHRAKGAQDESALIALTGCGGDAAVSAPQAAASTASDEATAPAIAAGSLAPGTYGSGAFEPGLRLTVDEPGWRALFTPDDDELALEHEDGRFLAFTRVTRVVDPRTDRDVPVPDDLAGWLSKHPSLQPTQTAPASIGGASGTRVDASAPAAQTELFWYPSGSMHDVPGVRWRVFVVDVDGTPLTVVFGAPAKSFEQGVARLDTLLASVELGR
jgi:hypothetical protein